MKRLVWLLPLLAFLALVAIAALRLTSSHPQDRAAKFAPASDERAAPAGDWPILYAGDGDTLSFTAPGGRYVVNLFASWCTPCRAEHPRLMELAGEAGIALVGVLYKDAPENGAAFLADLGDPYSAILADRDGRLGLEFGITGVPETFLVRDGRIVRHFRGPVSEDDLAEIRAFFAAP